jgi:hypothetical protein
MMGPEPMMRILRMSVLFGMNQCPYSGSPGQASFSIS